MNDIKVEVEEGNDVNRGDNSDNSCFICLQLIPLDNKEQFNSLNLLLTYLKIEDKVTSVVCDKCEENLARFVKLSNVFEKVRLEMDYLLRLFQSLILNSDKFINGEFACLRQSFMDKCKKAILNLKAEVTLEKVDISKLCKPLTCYRENPKLQIILPRLDMSKLVKTPPSNCSDDWSPNLDDEFDNNSGSTTSFATPDILGINDIKREILEGLPAVTDNRGLKRFSCTKCSMTLASKRNLTRHYDTVHLRLKPFKCSTCLKSFAEKRQLDRHVNNVHLRLKPYKCAICGMLFGEKSALKNHKECVHLRLKPFKCSKCPLAFSSRPALRKHINVVHLRLKQYKCEICDISFAKSRTLRLHKAKGHNDKVPSINANAQMFSCEICGKSYNILKSFKAHKKNAHYNSKDMFPCDICKKVFKRRHRLNVHVRAVHEKRREYCQVKGCGRSFSQRSQIFEHYTLEHPGLSVPHRNSTKKRCLTKSAKNIDNLKVDEIFKDVRMLNLDEDL